jgi:hypothetical protein
MLLKSLCERPLAVGAAVAHERKAIDARCFCCGQGAVCSCSMSDMMIAVERRLLETVAVTARSMAV